MLPQENYFLYPQMYGSYLSVFLFLCPAFFYKAVSLEFHLPLTNRNVERIYIFVNVIFF